MSSTGSPMIDSIEPKRVFILQGPQGSGKSTFTQGCPGAVVCSADAFFISPEGVYKYEAAKIADAHQGCLRRFVGAIRDLEHLIIVDNTNAQRWEMSTYVQLALAYNYEVEIHTFMIDPKVAFKRNVSWEKILRTSMFMESPLATWGRHTIHLPDGSSYTSKLDDPPPG